MIAINFTKFTKQMLRLLPPTNKLYSTSRQVPLPLSRRMDVLVLGAGLISRPLIKYLARDPLLHVTIVTNNLKDVEVFKNISNITTYDADMRDEQKLAEFVTQKDLVISLLPRKMHVEVAKACIDASRSLITPSYTSPEILQLDRQAREKGILIMNELGLAPGLDHMLAKRICDSAKSKNGKVTSYISWSGGLPSPKSVDNTMGYKFTWDPEGVLMNIWNPIKYIENGKLFESNGGEINKFVRPLNILDGLDFEGYPNRDASKYIELYDIPDATTVLRGTLRFKGFYKMLESFRRIGLLTKVPIARPSSWPEIGGTVKCEDFIRKMCEKNETANTVEEKVLTYLDSDRETLESFKSLGLLSHSPMQVKETPVQMLAGYLSERYSLKQGDRDWAITIQQLDVEWESGDKSREMVLYSLIGGDISKGEDTAMAVSVGLPTAIACKLFLKKELNGLGVQYPFKPYDYEPILRELQIEGFEFPTFSYPLFN